MAFASCSLTAWVNVKKIHGCICCISYLHFGTLIWPSTLAQLSRISVSLSCRPISGLFLALFPIALFVISTVCHMWVSHLETGGLLSVPAYEGTHMGN